MSELKPCPFCGGEAEIDSYYSTAFDRIIGLVKCKSCGLKKYGETNVSAYMVDTSAPDFPEWKKQAYETVENSAIEAWNDRREG